MIIPIPATVVFIVARSFEEFRSNESVLLEPKHSNPFHVSSAFERVTSTPWFHQTQLLLVMNGVCFWECGTTISLFMIPCW